MGDAPLVKSGDALCNLEQDVDQLGLTGGGGGQALQLHKVPQRLLQPGRADR